MRRVCESGAAAVPAEILEWDTAFFGFKVARVRGSTLGPEQARQIENWCEREGVRCLWLLCGADDPATIHTAEEHGYRLADIRITLEWKPGRRVPRPAHPVRTARREDIPVLEAISRQCYQDSRFYNDPGFPRDRVAALYETWIRRSAEGWADAVLVAEDDQGPAGYVTCHAADSRIGLVGVSERARGAGMGRTLVAQALEWFRARQARAVVVHTQGRNYAALRLYQSCGFAVQSVRLWFHKWRLL